LLPVSRKISKKCETTNDHLNVVLCVREREGGGLAVALLPGYS
jgi:hypothetical protein